MNEIKTSSPNLLPKKIEVYKLELILQRVRGGGQDLGLLEQSLHN